MKRKHSRNLAQRAATRKRARQGSNSKQDSLRDMAENRLTVGVVKMRLATTLTEIRKACKFNEIEFNSLDRVFTESEYVLIKAYVLRRE